MDIGEPEKIIIAEPLEEPEPATEPAQPATTPAEPDLVPA